MQKDMILNKYGDDLYGDLSALNQVKCGTDWCREKENLT